MRKQVLMKVRVGTVLQEAIATITDRWKVVRHRDSGEILCVTMWWHPQFDAIEDAIVVQDVPEGDVPRYLDELKQRCGVDRGIVNPNTPITEGQMSG